MKKSQNNTGLILMVASFLLLATSQWFWLNSEYKEHKRAFYNHADLLFKETVRAIEDSLASRALDRFFNSGFEERAEETHPEQEPANVQRKQPATIVLGSIHVDSLPPPDSIKSIQATDSSITLRNRDSSILQIITTIGRPQSRDSIESIKRVVSNLPKIEVKKVAPSVSIESKHRFSRRRYVFASAGRDSLDLAFNRRIKEVGYNVHFEVEKDSLVPADSSERDFRRMMSISEMQKKLRSPGDSVFVNGVKTLNPEIVSSFSIIPTIIFKATPEGLNRYLVSKIRNNILFSVFLLLLTLLTFLLIHRNIKKQARLNIMKNDLISNVSHELKTPLATLSVALEALQNFGGQANPDTTKEYLQISRNEVSRLSRMVDNILQTSLLEKQAYTINPTLINAESILENSVKYWEPRFTHLEGKISLKKTGHDFSFEGDELQIQNIINNLIDNAIKYSEAKPVVDILLNSGKNNISIIIKDKGKGIPKEYQNQVFEKFFRVPSGDKHNVKGYGLGLNFVKQMMDLHKARIDLESNDSGTIFTLMFNKKI